ncbi:hypothetical protein ACFL6L_03245 [candidate division KSB1 bacterium]
MTTLWDNIKKGLKDSAKIAKEGAHIVGEKGVELGKKSKIHYEISRIKGQIEKQFTELGGKVFHAMAEDNVTDFGADEEVNGFITHIQELESELRVKEEELKHVGDHEEDHSSDAASSGKDSAVETSDE